MKHIIYIVVILLIFASGCATLQRTPDEFGIGKIVITQKYTQKMYDAEKSEIIKGSRFFAYVKLNNLTVVNDGEKKISVVLTARLYKDGKLVLEQEQINYEGPIREDFDPEIHGWCLLIFNAYDYGNHKIEIIAVDRFAEVTAVKSASFKIKGHSI
jgi:hypothetical protein